MFKSKHSGWTWDLKRTPFGGGGGWNPVSAITDPISSALGTDGGGGGALGALASIDPGPAIGQGLAEVDKGVNQIPGGWYTVGGLAAGGTALAFAPELAALAGVDAGATIGSEAGQAAFFDALANGASSADAINAGLATDALATGAASYVTPELMGPTYGDLGITGVEGGMAGPTYAEMGYTGLNQGTAIASADSAARSALIKEALGNIKDPTKIAQLLKQGSASGLTSSLGKLAQGINAFGADQLQAVRGNQNPWLSQGQQQPIQTNSKMAAISKLLQQG